MVSAQSAHDEEVCSFAEYVRSLPADAVLSTVWKERQDGMRSKLRRMMERAGSKMEFVREARWVNGDTDGEKLKFYQSTIRFRELRRKPAHGRYLGLTDDRRIEERVGANERSRSWHDKAGMLTFYESALFDIREQNLPVKANYGKWYATDTKCRFCGVKSETIDHLTSGCKKHSFRDIKFRHDQTCRRVYYSILESIGAPVHLR